MTISITPASSAPRELRFMPKEAPKSASAQAAAPASGAKASLGSTATISPAALAALAASKELTETPAQTAQEARGSDAQAQRLLAKETAARHFRA